MNYDDIAERILKEAVKNLREIIGANRVILESHLEAIGEINKDKQEYKITELFLNILDGARKEIKNIVREANDVSLKENLKEMFTNPDKWKQKKAERLVIGDVERIMKQHWHPIIEKFPLSELNKDEITKIIAKEFYDIHYEDIAEMSVLKVVNDIFLDMSREER